MGFDVGQRVACINAKRTNNWDIPELYERGVYTIRWIGVFNGVLSVRLVEIPIRDAHGTTPADDHPFCVRRFRPVKQTSIEVFRQLLVNPPETVS